MYICSICKSELKGKTSIYVHVRSFLHKDNLRAIERNSSCIDVNCVNITLIKKRVLNFMRGPSII